MENVTKDFSKKIKKRNGTDLEVPIIYLHNLNHLEYKLLLYLFD